MTYKHRRYTKEQWEKMVSDAVAELKALGEDITLKNVEEHLRFEGERCGWCVYINNPYNNYLRPAHSEQIKRALKALPPVEEN